LPRASDRQEKQARWRAENSAFIAAYNQVVEDEGLPLEP
jgi:post-segregation antitoxin (ccd killing protein)